MRLGLKLFLATALAAVLVVPAAAAKPGNGNGGGNGDGGGKPSWAGQQGGGKANAGSQAKGKPAWAGQGKAKGQAKKAEQAQRKLDRRVAAEDPAEGDEGELEEPLRDNPAFVCKFERDMMGAEAFADEYGTNENKANAFGKCVSEEAQARDGAEGSTEEPEAPAACEPAEGEELLEGEDPLEGDEPVEGDDPAEGECPDDGDADSGEGDTEDGDTDEGSEEGSEDDGGSSADEILAALRLLL